MALVGVIDQGTTSTRFILLEPDGAILFEERLTHSQLCSNKNWHEHDAAQIAANVFALLEQAALKLSASQRSVGDVRCLSIANQRETAVAWCCESLAPLSNAIVWSDSRTDEDVALLSPSEKELIREESGLEISSYASAPKFQWLLKNAALGDRRKLRLGNVNSWLLAKLTDGREHRTDITNASRTGLMNFETGRWSEQLCSMFQVPLESLPTIHPNTFRFGSVASGAFKGVPIAGMIGDQQASLVTHATAHDRNVIKCTFGTGCFLMSLRDHLQSCPPSLVKTIGFEVKDRKYAVEGAIMNGANMANWFVSKLGLYSSIEDLEACASSVADSHNVKIIPSFATVSFPEPRGAGTAAIKGLSFDSDKNHLARAIFDSICNQVCLYFEEMERVAGPAILCVDGGLSRSAVLMQLLADRLKTTVYQLESVEGTAIGAAIVAVAGGEEDLGQMFCKLRKYRRFQCKE